jgi:transposase
MTKHFEFSPEILKEINYQRYHHLAPIVQRRMDAIRLKAHGMLHKDIAEIIGITENTLRDYFELYEQGGIEKLKELHYYQPESELKEHIVSLEAYFRDHPPATIKQAQHEVEVMTGVVRSETQIREFLKKTQSPLPKSRHAACESRSRKAERVSGARTSASLG